MLRSQTFYKKVNSMALCCDIIESKAKEIKKKEEKKGEIHFEGFYALLSWLVLD